MAFLSSPGSTNEVDTASIQVIAISTSVSTISSSGQIHENYLEEMDLKWKLALLSMRARRSPRNQESKPKNQDSSRKTVIVEDTSSKAIVAIDGAGFDWSYMANDEVPTNMAVMDFSNSEVSDSDEDESKEMVLKSDNVQHKPEQANQPRNVSQNPRNFAPTTVLTKSGRIPISTARQSTSRAVAPVSAVRPINTAASKPLVNVTKPRQNALQTTHSLSRKPFYQQTALKNRNLNNNVNAAKANSVNAAKANSVNTAKGNKVTSSVGNQGINAVKSSACWVQRPKIKVQDHVYKNRNISYLADFREHDKGYVAFRGGAKAKIEHLVEKKVKIIRFDNRTEFKSRVMNVFCKEKCIKREYRVARTPQQNEVAKRVLVVKPHFKTPYELLKVNNATPTYVDSPNDPLMPDLEEARIFNNAYYDIDEGIEAYYNNLEKVISVSPIPSTRIYKDHPKEQIIGEVNSTVQIATIEEEIYVSQPLGFVDLEFPDRVYKAEKALYGLHQAPKAWYKTLSTYLLDNGFRKGTIDKTLFIKKIKDDILLIQVYVDDIIFGSTKRSLSTEFD
nr:ribonuclease H-like domain-containing protein [Tanacetum cinerariifolium]